MCPSGGFSPVMTAEALLSRQYLGWHRNNEALIQGATLVAEDLHKSEARNIYYWYYATQMLHNMQGPVWQEWNVRVRDGLVGLQVTARLQGCDRGSWDPARPIDDQWGNEAGRHFLTCMSLLTLEVYYRYLPALQRDRPQHRGRPQGPLAQGARQGPEGDRRPRQGREDRQGAHGEGREGQVERPRTPALSVPEFALPRSHDAFARANKVIPGGVNSPARAFGAVGGEPPFMARAEGPVPLRHRRPPVHRLHRLVGADDPRPRPPEREARRRPRPWNWDRASARRRPARSRSPRRSSRPCRRSRRSGSSRRGPRPRCRPSAWRGGVTGRDKIIKMAGPLSRPRRRPARPGGLGRDDPRHAQQPRRHPGRDGRHDPLPVQRRAGRRRRLRRSTPARSPPSCSSRSPATWASSRPGPAIWKPLRELTEKHGAMLVFDEVMTGFRLAYGGAQERLRDHARPDRAGQDHRRRPAGGGLRRAAADHGLRLPRRPDLPGGHALRQPAGDGRRAGDPPRSSATSPPTTASKPSPPAWKTASAAPPPTPGVPHVVQRVGSMLTLFFHEGPVHDYADATPERHRPLRPLLLGDARPRRLSPVQPVRGRLRLRRPHRGRHRPHDAGGGRGAAGQQGLIPDLAPRGKSRGIVWRNYDRSGGEGRKVCQRRKFADDNRFLMHRTT